MGLSSRAGTSLLALVAARLGLTGGLSGALAGTRERRAGHDPGRVFCDLAVMLADGGRCVSDLAALAGQASLFAGGPVKQAQSCIDCGLQNRNARFDSWVPRSGAGPGLQAFRCWSGVLGPPVCRRSDRRAERPAVPCGSMRSFPAVRGAQVVRQTAVLCQALGPLSGSTSRFKWLVWTSAGGDVWSRRRWRWWSLESEQEAERLVDGA